ncbi:pantoate--beta-alanine ligase [Nocardioides sp. Y6]|uniref:Pantothenate synthetase n=1 Tax=Nocardioides malaquae TaxID=2773426 RepID=A0ABR9RV91_9ACTN|nr:pantoate--beta-alanine ligase [Nocardioides malaquae]MBE7325511.1 pantoate--beta-alanine ligase [Nocardioides malaquae]
MTTPRTPAVAHDRAELTALLADARAAGAKVGFVPTMGALHEGHASLVREARRRVGPEGRVVVSIFVNPLQFAPGEDLDRYPRTLDADLAVCAAEGVDLVFAPSPEEVYPGGVRAGETDERITVDPGPLAAELEGLSRPTHFRGVLTVVAKLFGLVRPDVAVFGEKDYQQLVLVRQMADNLCTGVEVVGAETVREPDGLALSSRNRYLDPEQRYRATMLHQTLRAAQEVSRWGLDVALEAARAELRQAHQVDLDYLEFRLPDLSPLPEVLTDDTEARVLIAARVGSTRLIDNLPLVLGVPRHVARAAASAAPDDATEGDS